MIRFNTLVQFGGRLDRFNSYRIGLPHYSRLIELVPFPSFLVTLEENCFTIHNSYSGRKAAILCNGPASTMWIFHRWVICLPSV